MKMDPKQFHMAPFGLIFMQAGSHRLWEASGMPPGPQNGTGKSKNPGFPSFSIFSNIFLSSLYSDMPVVRPVKAYCPSTKDGDRLCRISEA